MELIKLLQYKFSKTKNSMILPNLPQKPLGQIRLTLCEDGI